MKNSFLSLLFLLLLVLGLTRPAHATTPPPTGRPLTEALNPDGTLRAGANGSFDARQFRMGTAPDGRPVFRPTGTMGAGDERWQDGFGLPNGVDGQVNAVVQSGNDIYIGGHFTTVGNVIANYVAKWNGTIWSSLGTGTANGVGGAVYMLGVYELAVAGNGDVYAGGNFTQAGGVAANNIAKWNGTTWSPLGTGAANGVSGTVDALAMAGNGDVYVSDSFRQPGPIGTLVIHVAKWNGTAWSSLGTANGVNGNIYVLAVAGNGDVYAGGNFTQTGGVASSKIAKWNGTAWSSLGTGISNAVSDVVFALAVAGNGDVYVGGSFTQAGGVAASNIAKWNGTTWSGLGAGTANGVNSTVNALAVAGNGDVYVGGAFWLAGGTSANCVAKWNGTAWSNVSVGLANSAVNRPCVARALAVASNGDVYTSGVFTEAGGVSANYVAKWNGTAWSGVGTGTGNGVNGIVYALAVAGNGDVYVGGKFTQAGGVAVNHIAKWNGTAWSGLGAGTANGTNGNVGALAVAGNGDVYVGGSFTQAGGVAASNIAKWNGTAWSSLGAGTANGINGNVGALAVAGNGDVYAGGGFLQAGGITANFIARWNGMMWSSLGTGAVNGVNNPVNALAVASNGDVYVGGSFSFAGGMAASCVAKWNGTAWSSLGTGSANGVGTYVYALAVAGNGDVYVGGSFSYAGGMAASCVAKWNGTAWSSLGTGTANGVGGTVHALAVAGNGDVYVGGFFPQTGSIYQIGGVMVNNVAKWDGTAWHNLGTGATITLAYEHTILALAAAVEIYAGGNFASTGDGSKAMANFGIYDPNAPLATTAAKAAPAAQLYPNPAHGTATLCLPATAPRQPLTLTDALGRTVRRYPAPATPEAELDLRGLPAGAYVVRCGEYSQRLVVE